MSARRPDPPGSELFQEEHAGGPTDIQTDPRFAQVGPDLPKARQIGLRSRVAVPLASRGQIIGAFLTGSFRPDTYAEPHPATAREAADARRTRIGGLRSTWL